MRVRYLILISFCVTAALVLSSQTPGFSVNQNKDAVVATDADNGSKVSVTRDGILTVKLKAQLGTGYGWQVVKSKQFKSLGNPELESPDKGSPGGIERQVFRFKALTSGLYALELHYLRPWEKGVQPLKTYRLLVRVN